MSAFLCDPYHIGRLAGTLRQTGYRSFLEHHTGIKDLDEQLGHVALQLARMNVESVQARYPNQPQDDFPGWGRAIREYFVSCHRWSRYQGPPELEPLVILKACDCLEYQSCEVEGWMQHDGHFWLQAIRKAAIKGLVGYDEAKGWELTPPMALVEEGATP